MLLLLAAALGTLASAQQVTRFSLQDQAGVRHTAARWASATAIVIVFATPDCPYWEAYAAELNRLQEENAARRVLFYAVSPLAHPMPPKVRFPVLVDKDRQLAAQLGITRHDTTAVVVLPSGELIYRGRIDNRFQRPAPPQGRPVSTAPLSAAPTQRELADALSLVVRGQRALRVGPDPARCETGPPQTAAGSL